jgi:site-specific DNA-cytosine methylase
MNWILDLCSGFGGASEFFTLEENWHVVRIENNPLLAHVEHTAILDVHNFDEWLPPLLDEYGPPSIVWASPPCREFSLGYSAPQAVAARNKEPYQPDMSILKSCMEIIDLSGPSWYIIENVHGSKKWFEAEGIKLKQTIGPFQLYGHFGHLDIKNFKHKKTDGGKWSTDPLRNNYRAIVPIEISRALWKSYTGQTTLADWS